MKHHVICALLAAPLALTACQSEPEEAPTIEETIPVDPEPSDTVEANGTQSDSGDEAGTPDLPSTMESGSNPPGATAPPPGSKLQPAD